MRKAIQIIRTIRTSTQAHLSNAKKPVQNRRGIALMVAITSLMIIMYFAMEISYDSNVEYLVNAQGLNRVKAYYAAKSGMQLSLLRIKIYQQAQSKLGAQLGNSPLLDEIWKFPFAWPLPIPDELNAMDKDSFSKIVKDSTMDAAYMVTIEDEGSKIDLNDLASPSKTLQDMTKTQLLNIFQQKIKEDPAFEREYSNFRFDELVNSIQDWTSSKSQSANGGDKRSKYSDLNQEVQSEYYPPNRGFRTVAELHMIPGMTDDFYNLLESRVTIYGMKGINPNIATKDVLKSLDPAMTEEAVAEIIKRRQTESEGGPFADASDFWQFVATSGVRLEGNPDSIPLIFDSVINFKIRSSGEFAGATREITAIVMDLQKTADKVKSLVAKENENSNGQDPDNPNNPNDPNKDQRSGGNAANNTAKAPQKGAPRIVYWGER